MKRSGARFSWGLVAALMISGCAVGPDYQRPDVPLPEHFGSAADETASTRGAVATTWWTLFNDPLLSSLVDQALTNNADLAQAVARIEEADALLRQAGAALYPEVGLDGGASRSKISQDTTTLPAGTSVVRNTFRAAVSTAFELDFWGRLRRASEAARTQALATRYAKDTVQLSLVANVVQGYLSLRALDAQVEVTKETLSSRTRTQDLVQRRAAGGIASPLESHQAEIARASAQAQLAELVRQRELVLHQLAVLTGNLTLQLPTADLRSLPIVPVPPPGVPSTLLDSRPDIRQSEAQLASANALIGVAKAALFPSISLTGNVGGESRELSDLFSNGARIWSLGAVLDLPVFDAGRRSARVDEVTARQKQALAAYVQTIRVAFQEVNDALINLRQTAVVEQALDAQVKAATQAAELAEIRYEGGYSGFLEVLDAQRSANEAQLAYIRNRQQMMAASVGLFKALGGGWTEAGE